MFALLTSFDDDHRDMKQIEIEKYPETEYSNDVLVNKNYTSSSTTVTTETSSSTTVATETSSSIRFIPSILNFGEQ